MNDDRLTRLETLLANVLELVNCLPAQSLRQRRRQHRLTLEALAALIPVHWRTLYKWERGERTMHPVFEAKLQAVLDALAHTRGRETT